MKTTPHPPTEKGKKHSKSMLSERYTRSIVKHPELVTWWARGMRASELMRLEKKHEKEHPTNPHPWMPPYNHQWKTLRG